MNEDEKGQRAVEIAKMWWPDLIATAQFSKDDCDGVDAWLNGDAVQIKWDGRSDDTGNVVHELYEKPPDNPELPWRAVGKRAKYYIFVNEKWALKVSTHALAEAEKGKCLRSINGGGTALGFIVPAIELFGTDGWEAHIHGT